MVRQQDAQLLPLGRMGVLRSDIVDVGGMVGFGDYATALNVRCMESFCGQRPPTSARESECGDRDLPSPFRPSAPHLM